MKKRTIFDIEKIGFGDELDLVPKKAPSKPKLENKEIRTSSTIVRTSSSHKQVMKQDEIELPVTKQKAERTKITSSPKSSRFKPVEFVSPITGRREKRPKYVQLAYGQYQFSTSSVVETVEDAMNAFSNQGDLDYDLQQYENQEMGTAELTNNLSSIEKLEEEVLDVLTNPEDELFVCPCDTVKSKSNTLEADETKNDLQLSSPTTQTSDQESSLEVIKNLTNHQQEEIEVKTSLIKQTEAGIIITPSQMPSDAEEVVLVETPLHDLEETTDDIDSFEDENFCDEVLDSVLIEDDEQTVTYYETPNASLLSDADDELVSDDDWILSKMDILEQTFNDFGVKVRLTGDFTQGPTVTQIEIQPEAGTKISKISSLYNDLKLSLSVEELRIEPIPGKNIIGVEIPNRKRKMVRLKEILSTPEFMLHESPLCIGLGQDIAGEPTYVDILTMPHGLIAGQTGSGKSVCINTLLISILMKASPEDVRIMLIDPKRVELAPYNQIPHLVTPVIVDAQKAAMGLKWAVDEMERRYELFASNGVRDIKSFNNRRHEFEMTYPKLPYIVIVIDELADLMMVSAQEVEDYIMRITQKARAAGIHLIVATQRPTVDVITGTIKSNIPCRIAFAVAQGNDSRVILDDMGAQNLLGRGDMLLLESGSKAKRVQGAYVSDEEIDAVVEFVKNQGKPQYLIEDEVFEKGSNGIKTDCDPMLKDAMRFFFEKGYATVSSLQTRMAIGYNRAARIIDTLVLNGWIGEPNSSNKQREILISREEFESMMDETRI